MFPFHMIRKRGMLELMHDALSGRIGESDGDAGGSEKGQ